MYMIMIGVHRNQNNDIIGFRILDDDTRKIKDVKYNEVKAVLESGAHKIENLKYENGEVVGSNGALSRFPSIVNGRLSGVSPLIVLEEMPNNVYRVTNYAGEIVEIPEDTAIKYSNTYAIANGKIVTDSATGKTYLSSINGTYRKNRLIKDKQSGAKLSAKMNLIGEDRYGLDENHHAYAKDRTIKEIILGKGVLGIRQQGFKDCVNLTSIGLPKTLEYLGEAAFRGCNSLETIEIPEGVTTIPPRCFALCKNLKAIKLPNSIREIGQSAFHGCDSLAVIFCGPEPINIAFGAVPRGVQWKKRSIKTTRQEDVGGSGIKATMIAVVYSDNGIPSKYRIFDANSKTNKVMDVPSNLLIPALVEDKIKISNLITDGKNIICTNGQIGGYPKLRENGIMIGEGNAPFTIINMLGDKGYTIADLNGKTLKLSNANTVKLAKEFGVSNGRIVINDGVEIIQSLGEPYDVIEQAKSKLGDTSEDVDINIAIKSRAKGLKSGTNVDVSVQINDTDVFSVMTPEQKSVLKNYYVQYTLDLYTKMAKSIRLNLAPGKADKLAALRGEQDWEFAGVWDAGFNGASHCELGHALRYEYYAVPSSEGERRRRRRLSREAYEELDNNPNKIVFGEGCAADFFSISKEDMAILVKTRKTMSNEIKTMSEILTNNLQKEYMDKLSLLYSILSKLNTQERINQAFGVYLGETLMRFLANGMPFPKTLVIECSKYIRQDPKKFFITVFPEFESVINRVYTITSSSLYEGTKLYLNFIAENKIEGEYAYDPLDPKKTNERRDVGRYNKETRKERQMFNIAMSKYAMGSKYTFNELRCLLGTIDLLEELNGLIYARVGEIGLSDEETKEIFRHSYNYVREVLKEDADDQLTNSLSIMNAILLDNRFNIEFSYNYTDIYTYARYKDMKARYCNTPYYKMGSYGRLGQQSSAENAYRDLKVTFEYGLEKAVDDFINYISEKIKSERLEQEAEKKRQEAEELERKRLEEERLARLAEKIKREEEEKARKAEEEKAKREKELQDDKVHKLKGLMEKHKDFTEKSTDYGINVAKDIVSRGKLFKELSYKQQWRINQVLKIYEVMENGGTSVNEKDTKDTNTKTSTYKNVNNVYMLDENPEIRAKVEKVQSKADSVEMQEVLKKTPNVLKICYSIIKYGKASDKQLKHVYKALEILDQA